MLQSVIDQLKSTKAAQLIESKIAKTKGSLTQQTSTEATKALSWVVGKLVSEELKGENKDAVKAEIVSKIKDFDPRTIPGLIKPKAQQINLAALKELGSDLKDLKSLRSRVAKQLVESAERSLETKKTTKPAKEIKAAAKEAQKETAH